MTKDVDETFLVFTDGSYDPKLHFGVAGRLIVKAEEQHVGLSFVVETKTMPSTGCSRMEFEAIIWALDFFKEKNQFNIVLYTDCQAAANFSERIDKLKRAEFKSRRTGELLANADLYQKLAEKFQQFPLTINWTKGHTPKDNRDLTSELFAKVDKCVRNQLRLERHDR